MSVLDFRGRRDARGLVGSHALLAAQAGVNYNRPTDRCRTSNLDVFHNATTGFSPSIMLGANVTGLVQSISSGAELET